MYRRVSWPKKRHLTLMNAEETSRGKKKEVEKGREGRTCLCGWTGGGVFLGV